MPVSYYAIRRRGIGRRRKAPYKRKTYNKARMPRNSLNIMPRNRLHFATFKVQLTDDQTGGIWNQVISGVPNARSNHIPVYLDMFPRTTYYKRIYQSYKICKVKYEFIPVNTRGRTTVPNANTNIPTFTTLINRQSTTFPGTLNQALSVPYVKQTNAGSRHQHYFTPVTFDSVFRPAPSLTNALNPEYAQFLQVEYSNVPHHGVSWVMSESGNAWESQAFEYRVVCTIYVAFKGIKVDSSAP